jgi:hypothetical protein
LITQLESLASELKAEIGGQDKPLMPFDDMEEDEEEAFPIQQQPRVIGTDYKDQPLDLQGLL